LPEIHNKNTLGYRIAKMAKTHNLLYVSNTLVKSLPIPLALRTTSFDTNLNHIENNHYHSHDK
jgi:hypothetical protein